MLKPPSQHASPHKIRERTVKLADALNCYCGTAKQITPHRAVDALGVTYSEHMGN